MSGSDRDYGWYDQAWERGYQQGIQDGAKKEKNAGVWHIPGIIPEHTEPILAVVEPYDRGSRRYCRKNGLKYVRISGVYLSGDALAADFGDDPGEWADQVVVDPRHTVPWNSVVLWMSAELPEWFSMTEDEHG